MRSGKIRFTEKCPWCGGPVHRSERAAEAARHLVEILDWASREQRIVGVMRGLMPALRDAKCLAKQLEAVEK